MSKEEREIYKNVVSRLCCVLWPVNINSYSLTGSEGRHTIHQRNRNHSIVSCASHCNDI